MGIKYSYHRQYSELVERSAPNLLYVLYDKYLHKTVFVVMYKQVILWTDGGVISLNKFKPGKKLAVATARLFNRLFEERKIYSSPFVMNKSWS